MFIRGPEQSSKWLLCDVIGTSERFSFFSLDTNGTGNPLQRENKMTVCPE